jgi:phenylpropionate dioxygenase-like ring-hydroxylating dioxygenase large terminal subunit
MELKMAKTDQIPLNAWYAAAWGHEIGEALLARVICEIPLVMFRRRNGAISALEDVCPHRLAPLSMGRLEKDKLICGYHGMAFSAQGECVALPGAEQVLPSKANCLRVFPAVEQHKIVWVWPGDPNRADPKTIPDLHWADDPAWVYGPSYMQMKCDYRLILDNLMDLTHEAYVHSTSIGQDEIAIAPFEVSSEGKHVWLKRIMIDCNAPPFLAFQLKVARGLPGDHVDRWQIIRFEAPSTVVIDVGVAPTETGADRGDYAQGVNTQVLNTVTPGKAGEAHYFFGLARDFLIEDLALTRKMASRVVEVFGEDKLVLEAQQQMIDLYPDRPLRNYAIDRGGARVRQLISKMAAVGTVCPN